MKRELRITGLALLAVAAVGSTAVTEEKFQKLTAGQIRAKLAGMELTDNVHWRDLYQRAAPLLARHRGNPNVQGFVKGAYGAAIGTILGACVLLGQIAIGDWLTALIAAASLAVLFRWKVNNPLLMAVTAVAFPLLQPAWVMLK
jgi:hypothetical protein